jgi:hypothetical protein
LIWVDAVNIFQSPNVPTLSGAACSIVGRLLFFFTLASATWNVSIAFDVFKSISQPLKRRVVTPRGAAGGKGDREFLKQNALVWTFTAAFTAAAWDNFGEVYGDWAPGLSSHVCWITDDRVQLFVFSVPLSLFILFEVGRWRSLAGARRVYSQCLLAVSLAVTRCSQFCSIAHTTHQSPFQRPAPPDPNSLTPSTARPLPADLRDSLLLQVATGAAGLAAGARPRQLALGREGGPGESLKPEPVEGATPRPEILRLGHRER